MAIHQQDIENYEKKIKKSLRKSGLEILNSSIIEIESLRNQSDIEFMLPLMHLQIAVELLLKNYVVTIYGFDQILTSKYKKMKSNQPEQYLNELKNNDLKTLGFNDLKKFLEEKKDCFSYVIKDGSVPFWGMDYNYLENTFDKFQKLRNQFVHLGIKVSEEDEKWLEYEFYSYIIFFATTLIRESYPHNVPKLNLYDVENDLDLTPTDILREALSLSAISKLYKSEVYEGCMMDIAENISGTGAVYRCNKCGLETLALDIIDADGWSKCFGCGSMFYAGYADCCLCGASQSVVYDKINMDCNDNVMRGFCFSCRRHVKVYQCSFCERTYCYDLQHKIGKWEWKCCEENFHDRYLEDMDGYEI